MSSEIPVRLEPASPLAVKRGTAAVMPALEAYSEPRGIDPSPGSSIVEMSWLLTKAAVKDTEGRNHRSALLFRHSADDRSSLAAAMSFLFRSAVSTASSRVMPNTGRADNTVIRIVLCID